VSSEEDRKKKTIGAVDVLKKELKEKKARKIEGNGRDTTVLEAKEMTKTEVNILMGKLPGQIDET